MPEPSVFKRVAAEAPCLHKDLDDMDRYWCGSSPNQKHPACVLHALATSDEVREAWAELAMAAVVAWTTDPDDAKAGRLAVDAILAALRPEAT